MKGKKLVLVVLGIGIVAGGFFYLGQKWSKYKSIIQIEEAKNNILKSNNEEQLNENIENEKDIIKKKKESIIEKEYKEKEYEEKDNEIVKLAIAISKDSDYITMRAGRSWGFKEIRKIPIDETMKILGEKLGWYRVKWRDIIGYVYSGDVKVSEGQAPTEVKVEEPYEYVDYEDALINIQWGVLKNNSDMYIKEEKRKDSKNLEKLFFNSMMNILDIGNDGWVKVAKGNVEGYVPKSDFSQLDSTTFKKRLGTINSDNIKIMAEPFDNSEIIMTLNREDEVIVVGELEKDYYQIVLQNKAIGWVKVEDIVVTPWKKRVPVEK